MPSRSRINRNSPRRVRVNTRQISTGGLITDLNDVRQVGRTTLDDFPPREVPTPPIVVGSDRSIFVPRRILNDNSFPVPAEIADDLSGAGAVVPILLGDPRTVCLPYKLHTNNDTSNPRFVVLYIVGEGELHDYRTIWIDGQETDITAKAPGGWSSGYAGTGTNGLGAFWVGDGVQDVGSVVSTYVPGYTDTLEDFGIVALMLDSRVVARIPRVEVRVRGLEIKDYTTAGGGSPAYTNNAGNILAHWVEIVEGRTIDTASATVLADYCEETMADGFARKHASFAINRMQDTRATREVLRAHAGAWIVDTGSTVKFVTDKPATAVMDIGPDLIVGDVEITGPSLRDKVEDVVVTYHKQGTGQKQQARATGIISGKVSERRYLGINNESQAKRQAIEDFNHVNLEGDVIKVPCRNEAGLVEPGDVVNITSPRVGLDEKPYRVTQMVCSEPGLWVLQGIEYQPNVYSDSIETDPVIGDTNLDNPAAPPTVSGLTVTATNKISDSGISNQLTAAWTLPDFPFVSLFLLEVWNTDETPDTLEATAVVASDGTEATFGGLVGDTNHEIKIRIQSTTGTLGDYTTATGKTLHGNLIAHYPLEDGSQFTDIVGGATMTDNAGSNSVITGKVGDGRQQGQGNYYMRTTVGRLALLDPPWTILGWFQVTDAPTSGSHAPIFSRWTSAVATNSLFILAAREDTGAVNIELRYYDNGTNLYWDTGLALTESTWHFIALQYVNGEYRVKLDNNDIEAQKSAMQSSLNDPRFELANGWTSGNGLVAWDEVRVYSAALTYEEMETIRLAEV